MSCVASFHSGFEACFVCDIVCKWSRFSLWPRSPVASKKVSFVVSSARGRTLPSGAASGGFWDVTGKLLGTSGLPRECLGVLRGRLGEAFGSFGGVLGGFWELLEPLETPLGASGASQGGSWVLPEHLREALGSSRGPGERFGVLLGSLGKPLGAPRERTRRKSENHRFP